MPDVNDIITWAVGLGGIGSAAWMWWRTQRRELSAEEQERRRQQREEEERDLRERALPLTTVLSDLKAKHAIIEDGLARKTDELTQALVRIATSEQRLANAESRCALLERENVQCREEQGRQSQELQELRRRMNGLSPHTPQAGG